MAAITLYVNLGARFNRHYKSWELKHVSTTQSKPGRRKDVVGSIRLKVEVPREALDAFEIPAAFEFRADDIRPLTVETAAVPVEPVVAPTEGGY